MHVGGKWRLCRSMCGELFCYDVDALGGEYKVPTKEEGRKRKAKRKGRSDQIY